MFAFNRKYPKESNNHSRSKIIFNILLIFHDTFQLQFQYFFDQRDCGSPILLSSITQTTSSNLQSNLRNAPALKFYTMKIKKQHTANDVIKNDNYKQTILINYKIIYLMKFPFLLETFFFA